MERFELEMPTTVTEAIDLLPASWEEDGGREAMPLAGGQDLITVLKEGIHAPDRLVHLKGIADFRGMKAAPAGGLLIGAMSKVAAVAADARVRSGWRALAEAAQSVGSPQIRNQATLGGNLCQRPRCWYFRTSDAPCLKKGGYECFAYGGKNKYNAIFGGGPSYIVHPSDIAPALQLLGAEVKTQSGSGSRVIAMDELYTLPADSDVTRETVLGPDELIESVSLPALPAGLRTTYMKARERGSFDFALSAVALGVRMDGDKIAECRIVLGSVAPIPWRATAAEALAVGMKDEPSAWASIAKRALEGAEPLSENAYKVPLTEGLIEKAFRRLSMEDA
jgi:xanthine dehydrogenase YagS FAD-binding subunit